MLLLVVLVAACKEDASEIVRYGHDLHQQGKIRKAIEYYQKAIQADPKFVEAYLKLGHAFEDADSFEAAILQYKRGIEIDPDHLMLRMSLGNVYRIQGFPEKALEQVNVASKLSPGVGWIHDYAGNILEEMRDLPAALKRYEKAVKLEPNEPEFAADYANALLRSGDNVKAREEFIRMYRLVEGLERFEKEAEYAKMKIRELSR